MVFIVMCGMLFGDADDGLVLDMLIVCNRIDVDAWSFTLHPLPARKLLGIGSASRFRLFPLALRRVFPIIILSCCEWMSSGGIVLTSNPSH